MWPHLFFSEPACAAVKRLATVEELRPSVGAGGYL